MKIAFLDVREDAKFLEISYNFTKWENETTKFFVSTLVSMFLNNIFL
jgi:hypothetical protein